MCRCTPEIKTPFCGKAGCVAPGSEDLIPMGPVGVDRMRVTRSAHLALGRLLVNPPMFDYGDPRWYPNQSITIPRVRKLSFVVNDDGESIRIEAEFA